MPLIRRINSDANQGHLFQAVFIYYRHHRCPVMPFHVQMYICLITWKQFSEWSGLLLLTFAWWKTQLRPMNFQQSNHQKHNASYLQMLIEDKSLNKPLFPLCLANAKNKIRSFYVVLLNLYTVSQSAWILIVRTLSAGELLDLLWIKK